MEFRRSPEKTEQRETGSFRERFVQALQEHDPTAFDFTLDDVEKRKAEVRVIEEGIRNVELEEFLRKYGVEGVSLELTKVVSTENEVSNENAEKVYALKVIDHFSAERLLDGYAYKGGAARALLLRNLKIDPDYVPRDIDIVRLTENEPYEGADGEMASAFMADDFALGQGVEHEEDIDRYFATRDLTMNRVIATSSEVLCTESCLRDTVRKIIRPTKFERTKFRSDGTLGPKMLSKILRFYAEAVYRWDDGAIEGVEDWEFEQNFISPFWLAVQLDKAFEVSPDVVEKFVKELVKRGQLPHDVSSGEEAAAYLLELMGEDNFYYRHAPTEQFDMEEDWFDENLERLPRFRGHGKSRGDK